MPKVSTLTPVEIERIFWGYNYLQLFQKNLK